MTVFEHFVAAIRERLSEQGVSARAAALRAGLPVRSVNGILEGHVPSVERAAEVAAALGLEFYIGPTRAATAPPSSGVMIPARLRNLEAAARTLNEFVLEAGGDPLPEEMTAPERSERTAEPEVDPDPAPLPAEAVVPPEAAAGPAPEYRSIPSVEVRASAGTGEMVFEEPKGSPLRIDPDRLPRWARSHTLSCIGAVGDSMEPEINAGDVLVVATSCNEAVNGQIVVVHTDDGLVVKRNRKTEDGWELVSNNPKYPPRPATDDDRIVGRVAWHGSRREALAGSPED